MSRRVPSDKMITPGRPGPSLLGHHAVRLLESLPDVAFTKDHEGRYTFVNPAAEELLGRPASEILGRTDLELSGPERGAAFHGDDAAVLGGQVVDAFRDHARDGVPLTFHVVKAPLLDEAGRVVGIAGISRDVTTMQVHKELQRELQHKLLQAQKLDSLAVMAGGIAHDFNNLLAAILGNAELALQQLGADPEGARDCLKDIREASRRAADLSGQMLAFSGRSTFALREVDLNAEIRALVPLLESTITKKARLVLDLDAQLPHPKADAGQLRQLLQSLVANASEALGPEGGTIRVETAPVYWDAHALASSTVDDGLPPGEYIQLTVADDGCGMAQETQARIFDPFYSEKFVGRGLGLAAALGIVRGHRGAIDVQSSPGQGAAVSVALPFAATQSARPRRGARRRTPVPTSPRDATVLVVDDEPTVLSVVRRLLMRAGYAVLTAVDGLDALERLDEVQGEVGLVILDLTMPRLDGNETYAQLRERYPDLPVLLSSGYTEQEVSQRFSGDGLAGFLQKPYHPVRLLQQVQSALDPDRHASR